MDALEALDTAHKAAPVIVGLGCGFIALGGAFRLGGMLVDLFVYNLADRIGRYRRRYRRW